MLIVKQITLFLWFSLFVQMLRDLIATSKPNTATKTTTPATGASGHNDVGMTPLSPHTSRKNSPGLGLSSLPPTVPPLRDIGSSITGGNLPRADDSASMDLFLSNNTPFIPGQQLGAAMTPSSSQAFLASQQLSTPTQMNAVTGSQTYMPGQQLPTTQMNPAAAYVKPNVMGGMVYGGYQPNNRYVFLPPQGLPTQQ